MRIAITGSHGLVGTALSAALEERGDCVTAVGRSEVPDLSHHDAVINLAGAGIASRRWTEKYKKTIVESRVGVTGRVVEALNREAQRGHRLTFLSGSAVGFYGSRTSERLTERSSPGKGFLADVAKRWEAAALAGDPRHRTVLLRTGHVLAPHGGLLSPQRPLFLAGLGGPIGSGTQFQPWITLSDYVRAVLMLLDTPRARGPVNMTSPNPVRQRYFARAFGASLGRPALVSTPAWAPSLVFGAEMAEELVLASQRAMPSTLVDLGFEFMYPDLGEALEAIEAERSHR